MPSKYKAGDKVRIVDSLIDNVMASYLMLLYSGCPARIVEVYESCYKLDVDGGYWNWTDDMLKRIKIVSRKGE